jgi:hypothetical protein
MYHTPTNNSEGADPNVSCFSNQIHRREREFIFTSSLSSVVKYMHLIELLEVKIVMYLYLRPRKMVLPTWFIDNQIFLWHLKIHFNFFSSALLITNLFTIKAFISTPHSLFSFTATPIRVKKHLLVCRPIRSLLGLSPTTTPARPGPLLPHSLRLRPHLPLRRTQRRRRGAHDRVAAHSPPISRARESIDAAV